MNLLRTALVVAFLAPAAAVAAEWTVDTTASHIGFSGTQLGQPFSGRFNRFFGKIDFDPTHPEKGHVLVTIDMTSAATGDKQRDEALPQPDWFDASATKQASFEATSFVAKGAGAYEAIGTLTIRGVHRDVTLPFQLALDGRKAHAIGHMRIVRTDFHVGQGDWASGDWVGLDVGLDIDVTANRD